MSERLDVPGTGFCRGAEVVCEDLGKICFGARGPDEPAVRAVVGVDARGVANGDFDLDGVCDRDTKCLPLNASANLKG